MPIPKIIHYCWLSDDPISEEYTSCVDSWRKKLPSYEFILWDIKRFDVNSTAWTKQSFEVQLYACACDYIRLHAIHTHGGIYLDMDMEVVKPFDSLLQNPVMLAYENHVSENIEAGCFGAEKGNQYIKKCMEYFENRNFFDPKLLQKILRMNKSERHDFISPLILPEIMKNTLQESFVAANYTIYPYDYFTAKNIETGKIEATKNTVTIHHFVTDYHSGEWRKIREWEQSVKLQYGEKSVTANLICKLGGAKRTITKLGLFGAQKYYFSKYISTNNR
jgi:mannosyltransferase OCH1-like enzyme